MGRHNREPEGTLCLLVYDGLQQPVNLRHIPRENEEVIPPTGGPVLVVSCVRHNLTGATEMSVPDADYAITIYLRPRA